MFKSLYLYLAIIVPVCAIAGCGGAPKELPVAKSAHGGTMVPLPGDQGFVEVLVDTAVAGKAGRKAQVKPRFIAYFTQPDGTTEMSPGPTDVKIKIGMGEDGRVVDLSAEPKEAGKYASAVGDYPEGFAGQLKATLNGQPVEVPVRVR
jgi:hypothetical protein